MYIRGVGDRPPNGTRVIPVQSDSASRWHRSKLPWAIQIMQLAWGRVLRHLFCNATDSSSPLHITRRSEVDPTHCPSPETPATSTAQVQCGDSHLLNDPIQIAGFAMPLRPSDHSRAHNHQWPEKFPYRHVEPTASFATLDRGSRLYCCCIQCSRLTIPRWASITPFGRPRGSGRIDDIGQVMRASPIVWD